MNKKAKREICTNSKWKYENALCPAYTPQFCHITYYVNYNVKHFYEINRDIENIFWLLNSITKTSSFPVNANLVIFDMWQFYYFFFNVGYFYVNRLFSWYKKPDLKAFYSYMCITFILDTKVYSNLFIRLMHLMHIHNRKRNSSQWYIFCLSLFTIDLLYVSFQCLRRIRD